MADNEPRVIHLSPEVSTWTPAQILALVVGVAFIVLGGVALLRTGIGQSVFEPTTTVAGLSYTPLLGLIEVIFGLILLAVGAFPGAAQGVVFLGILALAGGLLLVIEPTAFQSSIAAGRAHGWFYVVVGAVLALVGLVTPTALRRRATAVVRDHGHEGGHRGRPRRYERDDDYDYDDGGDGYGRTSRAAGETRRIDYDEEETRLR
jgi:predicted anti-sigma-YlaC factor YlaD